MAHVSHVRRFPEAGTSERQIVLAMPQPLPLHDAEGLGRTLRGKRLIASMAIDGSVQGHLPS